MRTEESLATWCQRLVQDDREALGSIFRLLHAPLVRFSTGMLKDEEAARDIVQEAFIKLWELRHTFGEDFAVKGYLYRTVRNLSLNFSRDSNTRLRKAEEIRMGRQGAGSDSTQQVDAQRLDSLIRTCIQELPPRQKEVILLSRYEGLSHDEIASAIDVSPRTVNNHLVRGLQTIRNRIAAYEPDWLRHETG